MQRTASRVGDCPKQAPEHLTARLIWCCDDVRSNQKSTVSVGKLSFSKEPLYIYIYINYAWIFGKLFHKLSIVTLKHHSADESPFWKQRTFLTVWCLCSFSLNSLLNFAHFEVQTSFFSLSTNLPSVFIASILPLKAIRSNSTAPHCLSVYFPKGTPEPVYWLLTLPLPFFLPAHATLMTKSRSLPCSPPCHQSHTEKQNFLSRYFLPPPPPSTPLFSAYDKYTFPPNIISDTSSSIQLAA